MKHLNQYINEKLIAEWSPAPAVAARTWLGKSVLRKSNEGSSSVDTIKFIHHVLDIMYEMAKDKEKYFGVKYDEICGNLVGHLWQYDRTLSALESDRYIRKYGNIYNILLTTTTERNGFSCEESVPVYELTIPNTRTMQDYKDDIIKDSIIKAANRLKKTVKMY